MKYLPLFSLNLRHSYYTNGRCPDFQILPTVETQRLLKNQRSILKTNSAGVQVLMPVNDDQSPFISLPETAVFTFHLYLQNKAFPLFTELTKTVNTSSTSSGTTFTVKYPVQPQRQRNTFAEVDIHLPIPKKLISEGAQFQIMFEAKQMRWCYYVIVDKVDDDKPGTQFHVEDKADSPIKFSEENRTDLNPIVNNSDDIALSLAKKYPTKQRYRFLSDDVISCRQQARKSLQLLLGEDKVVDPLPNPPLSNFFTPTTGQNGESQKEATLYLYQIIKYFNQDSLTGGI